MIPSVIASQVKRGIEDFLRTTYPPEDPFFENILENFFQEQGTLFRGPFLSLKLPFRPGSGKAAELYPELPMKFPPYKHQELAFERLSADEPLSTLIATGTGSGKTECFMYPLLDHCYRNRGKRGVKAIIIYPMNALATDQAKRFAKEIYNNSNLRGNVSAGLFIGGLEDDAGVDKMTADSVITCKNTMRKYPPDILMTNYKMLDFLLLRPKDYPIWQYNTPDTLQYIVVDELHTFDGAQGTDLACLMRRLFHRLKTSANKICFAGTSATLGSGQAGRDKMLSFAGKLFGTTFDEQAIITEDLLNPKEFIDVDGVYYPTPSEAQLPDMQAENYTNEQDYLRAQCKLWFGDDFVLPEGDCDDAVRMELGDYLRKHLFFQRLIELLDNKTLEEETLSSKINQVLRGFNNKSLAFQNAFIDSIFALVSFARRKIFTNDGKELSSPFLQVRSQLWLREMRRMVASVEENPKLRYAADLQANEAVLSLPVIHCRSCGHIGYLSTMHVGENKFSTDLQQIYSAFFAESPTVHYIFPYCSFYGQQEFPKMLCGHCLTLSDGDQISQCPSCGKDDKLLKVRVENPRHQSSNSVKVKHNCPFCDGEDTLTVLGSRSASLTSVVISQLFASQYNDDPKLLAFSDSVQDASHRAGFFSARTFHFNLRAAIQQALEACEKEISMADFVPYFIDFWKQKLGGAALFVAQFIPPDLQWKKDYEDMLGSGTISEESPFFNMIQKRIHWEILSEYGYRAQVGRTLEKSGCSIACIDESILTAWSKDVRQKLSETIGPLKNLTEKQTTQFLLALLRMLRIKGGISAEYLHEYMKNGNSFGLQKSQPFMPGFAKGRAPVFVYIGSGAPPRFDALIGSGKSLTKYQKMLECCWGDVTYYSEDIFRAILETGNELNVFQTISGNGFSVWGVNPQSLLLCKQVKQLQCNKTRHRVAVAEHEYNAMLDMPSFRIDVPQAKLEPFCGSNSDYYGELYQYGRVHRVIAREHTGLLERDDRENLEKSFINGENLAAPNILSCTPTLEMGINIGDLSSVILCSMPPAQANYVQRIGRAGRRDGNAFNFVVAAARPHDLHFFAEPLEMITGEVSPPGIFLNAPAVLERQLTAFCFDQWIASIEGAANQVPINLKDAVDAVAATNQQKFPYTLLNFISLKREELLAEFFKIFPGILTEETKKHLQNFMRDDQNNGLDRRILGRLEAISKERKALRDKLASVNKKIKTLENLPQDNAVRTEIDDLQFEKHALQDAVVLLNKKLLFNFFTDEGLLPNYAFPEAGVSLRSIVYRKKEGNSEDGKKYDTFTKEYERSGKSAIQEFAPGNAFYVDGRKLLINRINMTDTPIERWHFCGCCNYIEKVTDDQHSVTCPKCGSPTWADSNLIRNVLRLRQVISNLPDKDSRSYDEKDEREPVFYNKFMLAELSRQYAVKAYKVTDENFPFGIEFLCKATFREVNFGKQDAFEGNTISIATQKVSREGFVICKDCGVVAEQGKELKHAVTCKHYGKTETKGVIECLYLYREFESEALRLLLPLEDFAFESKINSFIAALYMGLKERFEGSVDHIQVMLHEEPLPETTMRKRYIVLYDQIPGGTGYLKQLANTPDDFMEMLQKAKNKLDNCSCVHSQDKDGCYSCLYAYRVSHDLPNISRKAASDFIAQLLNKRHLLQQTETIEDISVNSLFESDLEMRFIEGLRRSSFENMPLEVKHAIINGKSAYTVKVKEHSYTIEPQVEIGIEHGVAVSSRVDFLITPLRQTQTPVKPIAIFTDGFQFHADINSEKYRLDKDLEQRMALIKSGKFHCWSLSYQDVMTKFNGTYAPKVLFDALKKQFLPNYFYDIQSVTPFDALIMLLAHPYIDDWQKLSLSYAMSFSRCGRLSGAESAKIQDSILLSSVFDYSMEIKSNLNGDSGFWMKNIAHNSARLSLFSVLAQEDIAAKKLDNVRILVRINDADSEIQSEDFQILWNDVLHALNLLQFCPHTTFVTDRFVKNKLHITEISEQSANDNVEWKEIFEVSAHNIHPVIEFTQKRGYSCPIPGYELTGNSGEVLAMADLAWEEKHLAVFVPSDDEEIFSAHGWQVINIGTDNHLQIIKHILDGKE